MSGYRIKSFNCSADGSTSRHVLTPHASMLKHVPWLIRWDLSFHSRYTFVWATSGITGVTWSGDPLGSRKCQVIAVSPFIWGYLAVFYDSMQAVMTSPFLPGLVWPCWHALFGLRHQSGGIITQQDFVPHLDPCGSRVQIEWLCGGEETLSRLLICTAMATDWIVNALYLCFTWGIPFCW